MNLNDYLTITGTNQITAAAQIGCSRSLMSRWCAGKVHPGRHWWARIQAWSRGAITADVAKILGADRGRK